MWFSLGCTIWKITRFYRFDCVCAAHLEYRSLVLKDVWIAGIWIRKKQCWQKKTKFRKTKSMQHELVALQWEKSSRCSILIFVISLFGCHPALDARDRHTAFPSLCTPLFGSFMSWHDGDAVGSSFKASADGNVGWTINSFLLTALLVAGTYVPMPCDYRLFHLCIRNHLYFYLHVTNFNLAFSFINWLFRSHCDN